MKSPDNHDLTWRRLAHAAAQAPPLAEDSPHGFATRVVARWKDARPSGLLPLLEKFVIRGLAVAMVILLGSAAVGYDSLMGVFSGDMAPAGGWIDSLLTMR